MGPNPGDTSKSPDKAGRRNILTNNKVDDGRYRYICDPYDRAKELSRKEYLDNKAKIIPNSPQGARRTVKDNGGYFSPPKGEQTFLNKDDGKD